MKKSIQMEELVCPMCAQKIENALKRAKGIQDASVSYNASKAKVEFDESQISLEEIKNIIINLGYEIIK